MVRHNLPVVAVMGNNGIWGLEKHPMEFLYGYSVAADLQPGLRYDKVVEDLGGHGELVERPEDLKPARGAGVQLRQARPRERAHRSVGAVPAPLEPGVGASGRSAERHGRTPARAAGPPPGPRTP